MMGVLSDYEAAYLISGVNHDILADAVDNRNVKAGNMIWLCKQMNEMFGTEEYQGIIDYTELWLDDRSLAEKFLFQYLDSTYDDSSGTKSLGWFDDEGEKKAFIESRGEGNWYDDYKEGA
jgi:hypothetical protein